MPDLYTESRNQRPACIGHNLVVNNDGVESVERIQIKISIIIHKVYYSTVIMWLNKQLVNRQVFLPPLSRYYVDCMYLKDKVVYPVVHRMSN